MADIAEGLAKPHRDRAQIAFGDKPAMTGQDINGVIAFVKTLNGGYEGGSKSGCR